MFRYRFRIAIYHFPWYYTLKLKIHICTGFCVYFLHLTLVQYSVYANEFKHKVVYVKTKPFNRIFKPIREYYIARINHCLLKNSVYRKCDQIGFKQCWNCLCSITVDRNVKITFAQLVLLL